MLGEPALVARHHRGDAQRQALFAEQGIAAIAGAEGPDFARFGKLDDPFLFLTTGPGDVLRSGHKRRANRMHARHECAVFAKMVYDRPAHARHQLQIDRDVRRIRQFDTDLSDVGADRTH